MSTPFRRPHLRAPLTGVLTALLAVWMAVLQGCSTPPSTFPGDGLPESQMGRPAPKVRTDRVPAASLAFTDKAYRQDAARHLYAQQAPRIYAGRLPPMLYAVGVLNVDIDRQGQIQALRWMRAPKHAPEVMAEIEQMVRAAAPFPAPKNLAKVTYTDVWLWHKSGRFQLDTLTEGQD